MVSTIGIIACSCASGDDPTEQPTTTTSSHTETWPASAETEATLGVREWTLDVAADGSVVDYVGRGANGVDRGAHVTYRQMLAALPEEPTSVLSLPDGELRFFDDTTIESTLPANGRWEQILFGLLLDRTAAARSSSVVISSTSTSLFSEKKSSHLNPRIVPTPGLVPPGPGTELVSKEGVKLLDCEKARQTQLALASMQTAFACTPGEHTDPRVHPTNSASNPEACARQREAIAKLKAQVDAKLEEKECAIQLVAAWDFDWLIPSCNDIAKITGVAVGIVGQGMCANAAVSAGAGGALVCSPSVVGAAVCAIGVAGAVEVACLPVAIAAGAAAHQAALPTCEYIRYMMNSSSNSESKSDARIEYRYCTKPVHEKRHTSAVIVACLCNKPVSECKCPGTGKPPEWGEIGQSSCDRGKTDPM